MNYHPVINFVVTRIKSSSYYTVGDFFYEIDDVTLDTLYGFLGNLDQDAKNYTNPLDSYSILNFYLLATLLYYGEGETKVNEKDLESIVDALATLVLLEKAIRKQENKAAFEVFRRQYSLHDKNKIIAKRKSGV